MSGSQTEANSDAERCLSCEEDTSVGSIFFSDRHTAELKDGTRGYLCSDCARKIRSKGHHEGVSAGRMVEVNSIGVVGSGWGGGGF